MVDLESGEIVEDFGTLDGLDSRPYGVKDENLEQLMMEMLQKKAQEEAEAQAKIDNVCGFLFPWFLSSSLALLSSSLFVILC